MKKTYYIIENRHFIREVRIIKFIAGMYTINLVGTDKYLRVHPSRLYATQEDASSVAYSSHSKFSNNHNAQLL